MEALESIVRKLRDGRVADSSTAPLVLVIDDVHAPAAPVVFRQVLHMLTSAVEAGRAQAMRVALIALACPPACLCTPSPVVKPIDMFSNNTPASQLISGNHTWAHLQQHTTSALQQEGFPHVIVLDSLPAMCFKDSADMVTMLADLCNHPHTCSVLARVHKDLLSPPDLQRLLRLCSTWLELQPCTAAEQRWAAAAQGLTLHGTATARHKRAAGRVRVDVDGYAADHCGLRLTPPPVPPSTAAQAVALVLGQGGAAASAADGDALAAQVAGGMRLTLSQQERASRTAVVLPYEQQRGGAADEADWRDRLPRAAGGRGPATHAGLPGTAESGQLGHIDYTRDTDEEVDSDEDPDEDLDL